MTAPLEASRHDGRGAYETLSEGPPSLHRAMVALHRYRAVEAIEQILDALVSNDQPEQRDVAAS